MSRIGKQPILILKGVKTQVQGGKILVEGPKGSLSMPLDPLFDLTIEGDQILLKLKEGSSDRARYGLLRSLIANMIRGCAEGFKKELEVVGVGYKAAVKGKELELSLGFSHPVTYPIPDGITISVEAKTNRITIEGADRQLVGQTAAEIRSFRKPEPYKGKGIKYAGEYIRRKVGKAAATATTA